MKSGVVPAKTKKPRASKKRAAPKRTAATAAITLSVPTISKKRVWKKSFAPKRPSWYEPFYTVRLDTHTGISAVLVTAVLLFGFVFGYNALENKPAQEVAHAELIQLSEEPGALQQTLGYVTKLLYVPGGYTDTSASPPEVTLPMGPVNDQTLHDAVALLPYFKQSLAETTTLAFDASFGTAARVFIGSVQDMGDMANKTVAEEFNLAAVFGALQGTVTHSH